MKKNLRQFFLIFTSLLLVEFSPITLAVDFSFIDTEGESHQLSQYKGKWVVVNFWATWCPPCRKEIPDLSDFHFEQDNSVVIGVNYEPGLKDVSLKKFMDLYLMSYPVTRVNDAIIEAVGEPRGLPTTVLINPEGNVVKKISGMVTQRHLNKLIEKIAADGRQS
jgi:thiol-disulfide isomerase/thioredoxin